MSNPLPHSFQSEHSPRGASAAFSLGHLGHGGGFSLESGNCGTQDVYLGYLEEGTLNCLPYNSQGADSVDTGMAAFIPTGDPESEKFPPIPSRFFESVEISRDYHAASDTFRAGRLTFTLFNPVKGILDPATVSLDTFRDALCPALIAQLTLDNRTGTQPLRGFFALGGLPGFRQLDELTGGELMGVTTLAHYGFATQGAENITPFSDMFLDFPFRRPAPNRNFAQGLGGLIIEVAPGTCETLTLALGWYRPGIVTLGKDCTYLYTRHYANLVEVLRHALAQADRWIEQAARDDAWLAESGLNPHRQFLLAKSIRSYWGNTQLLAEGDRPRWVVNEGSCNMANTLDLTVDMAFWECREHPWLLRNVLDASADEYAYTDTVHAPEEPGVTYPGGVSFTHDHGFRNVFTRPGHSHYEARNHPACFSYMTHEELLNWLLCAALYLQATDDQTWRRARAGLFADLLDSLLQRDHHDPAQRNGVMGMDSDRCGAQSEITTYDSLDPSLGQARNNTYMALKCWAGYLALAQILEADHPERWAREIRTSRKAAGKAARTIATAYREDLGYIPALLEEGDTSAIIPIIEALVYPQQLGMTEAISPEGPFGELLPLLRTHLQAVLKPGTCLFPDGGWKLSANNDNSWMSKIFICQHVAETILGLPAEEAADRAHDHWWRVGCAAQSVVDQVVAGQSGGRGSTYPRTVSGILWLED